MIAIKAFAEKILSIDEVNVHLDKCLLCRACESACPSDVPYYSLVNQFRELAWEHKVWYRKLFEQVSLYLISHIASVKWYALLQVVNWLPFNFFQRARCYLNQMKAFHPLPESKGSGKKIGLFTGCVSSVVSRDLLQKLQAFLSSQGFEVVVPQDQLCCGALYKHSGLPGQAEACCSGSTVLFNELGVEDLLFVASGCGAYFQDATAGKLSFNVWDANEFVLEHVDWSKIAFEPLSKTVMLHVPCSQQGFAQSISYLLQKIPDITLLQLDDKGLCCGGAGNYFLQQPQLADQLLKDKLIDINARKPDILLTSNTGCQLHFQVGLEMSGVEVMHPVELLIRQISI